MPNESWVSVEDVANHLGITKDAVYPLTNPKDLPAQKIGRLWQFMLSDVGHRVKASGTESAGSEPETVPPGRD